MTDEERNALLDLIGRLAHRAVGLLPSKDRRQELVEARTLCILIEDAARTALRKSQDDD